MSTREAFSNSAKSGKVLLAKCTKCDTLHLAMVMFCEKCGSRKFTTQENDAKGTVVTYTIITIAPEGFENLTPYAWVVMALDGTNLRISGFMKGIGSPDDLLVGSRIKVTNHDERGVIIERD